MKALIVGLGSIGKRHLQAIQQLDPAAEVFALRSQANAPALEGVQNVYSLSELPAGIDFAIVSNPTAAHAGTIEALLPLGCALFIEKPLHSDLAIEALLAQVAAAGVKTYVACNLRFHACLQFVQSQLAAQPLGQLNEVNVYCGSYLPDWRPGQDFRTTYSANADMGGGVHIDLIHELDYLYWMFGKPMQVQRLFRSQSTLAIPAIDYANFALAYPGFAASVVLNYFRRDPKRELELVFEAGTWTVDLRKNQVSQQGELIFSSEKTVADTYFDQMAHFYGLVMGEHPSLNTIQDAYNVLQICIGQ